eukprot:6030327-Alexandrium_andersonii.AAC.1
MEIRRFRLSSWVCCVVQALLPEVLCVSPGHCWVQTARASVALLVKCCPVVRDIRRLLRAVFLSGDLR